MFSSIPIQYKSFYYLFHKCLMNPALTGTFTQSKSQPHRNDNKEALLTLRFAELKPHD